MSLPVKVCKGLNKKFKLPTHPFNLKNSGANTYASWQFDKGYETIKIYLNQTTPEKMFKDKVVLDIGCGAGGKTIYYSTLGVKKIYGLEILEKYKEEAEKIAKEKGILEKFVFISQDASCTSFENETFDTIIMNDCMEHFENPEKVLCECYRILKKGGMIYLNFPPYYHPYGAHLSDAIGIPWVHCIFSDKTLISVYKDLVSFLPDGNERMKFRISADKNGVEYFSYINKMSIKRFKKILNGSKLNVFYYNEIPLRRYFKPVATLPITKEYFVKMVVCILCK